MYFLVFSQQRRGLLLAQVVEDHDVGVHVEEVVAVGWVVIRRPLFWLWAPERELVAAVFGLVVDAVKTRHLVSGEWNRRT